MGLLKSARTRVHELEAANGELEQRVQALTRELADLQREVSSLLGRVRAAENTAYAASNRGERLETRVGKLEYQVRLPDAVERSLPPSDEDAFQILCPEGHEPCPTCEGRGRLGGIKCADVHDVRAVGARVCHRCGGKGFIPKLNPVLPQSPLDAEAPTRRKTCSTCRGAGHFFKVSEGRSGDCTSCGGRGFVEVEP